MPVNRYFEHEDFSESQEQNLLQCLVDETIQIHGLEIYYIPRTEVNTDYLFGEDLVSNFNSASLIEMYLETFEGWDSDGDILSKFGLVIADSAKFVVSRKRFDEEITSQFSSIENPRIGDLLYYPKTDAIFEVKTVEEEAPFYQIGSRYTYRLTVEKFSYSHETINTGISEIDDLEDDYENDNSTANLPGVDNTDIESEADGSVTDGFNDSGNDDRGEGVIDYSEQDPLFDNY